MSGARTTVSLLVAGDYETAAALTSGHLSADDFRSPVQSLESPLAEPPEWEWARLPMLERPPESGEFDLVVPLWTVNGRSFLAIEFHVIATGYGTFETRAVEFRRPEPIDYGHADREFGLVSPRQSRAESGVARSDRPIPERWRPILWDIVHRLAIGDYVGLAADGLVSNPADLPGGSIGYWIEDYPATLVDLPDEGWEWSEFGENPRESGSWWVIVDLWTAEEGLSDLSMEARVWDDGTTIAVLVDGVHVM